MCDIQFNSFTNTGDTPNGGEIQYREVGAPTWSPSISFGVAPVMVTLPITTVGTYQWRIRLSSAASGFGPWVVETQTLPVTECASAPVITGVNFVADDCCVTPPA